MTKDQGILYLSETMLAGLGITTDEVIDSIEKLISQCAKSRAWSAPKAVIQPADGRYMMAALAAADNPPLLAVKTVVLNPRNPDRGLPQINGLITLLDSETGLPVAITDGNWVTAVRTAGLSATAAKKLAKPDSSVAAFVGCGVQAQSHLKAFADMFPLKEVRVFGRGRPNIEALCRAAEGMGLTTSVHDTGQEAIAEADLIVSSVTYSAGLEPFLDARRLMPGCFAAVTDLAAPWIQEGFSGFDRIVIDDVAQEAAMPNKLVRHAHVNGDLSGLVLGDIEGRAGKDERTAFIFRGHALGDLALAALAYRKARASSQGTLIHP